MESVRTIGVLTLNSTEAQKAAEDGQEFKKLVKQTRQAWRTHQADSLALGQALEPLGVSLQEGKSFGWFRMKLTQLLRFLTQAQSDTSRQKAEKATLDLYYCHSLEEIRAALNAGADVNHQKEEGNGNTPLHNYSYAHSNDRQDIVGELIDAGAKISTSNKKKSTPLGLVCVLEETADLARIMIEKADRDDVIAALNHQNGQGNTPLHTLALWYPLDRELLQRIVELAPEVRNIKNNDGETPYEMLPPRSRKDFAFLKPDAPSSASQGADTEKIEDGLDVSGVTGEHRTPEDDELLLDVEGEDAGLYPTTERVDGHEETAGEAHDVLDPDPDID
jgi:hypothetical protein